MAFVRIDNGSLPAWSELRFDPSFRFGQTALKAADGGEIVALPDIALDELDDRGIGYELLSEQKTKSELSMRSREYLENLECHHPELIYFDGPLPPLRHVEMFFRTAAPAARAATEILEGFDAKEIRSGFAGEVIGVHDDEEAVDQLVTIRCMMPRYGVSKATEALIEAGIAGYSGETAIYTGRDPDA